MCGGAHGNKVLSTCVQTAHNQAAVYSSTHWAYSCCSASANTIKTRPDFLKRMIWSIPCTIELWPGMREIGGQKLHPLGYSPSFGVETDVVRLPLLCFFHQPSSSESNHTFLSFFHFLALFCSFFSLLPFRKSTTTWTNGVTSLEKKNMQTLA